MAVEGTGHEIRRPEGDMVTESVNAAETQQTARIAAEDRVPTTDTDSTAVHAPRSGSDTAASPVAASAGPLTPTAHASRRRSRLHSSWQFIAFALVFLLGGAAFIAITPPGLNPDEPTHVYRAWQVAHGGLVSEVADGQPGSSEGSIGGMIPAGWPELFEGAHFRSGFLDSPDFRDLDWSELASIKPGDHLRFLDFTNTAQYAPVAYVPQAAAIWVGEGLDLGVLATLELGRAFGLVVVAGLLLLAARLTPVGRLAFFAVGLFPSVISQAGAFSADGVTIGLCVLATALVLRWGLREGAPGWWRWCLLGLLFVGIALVKPTYAPLAVIAAVIPALNPAARKLKPLLSAAAVIVVAAVSTLGWLSVTSFITKGVNPLNDPAEQKAWVIAHPLAFLKAAFRSLVLDYPTGLTDQKGELWRGLFGSFSWLRTPLPILFVVLLVVVVVVALLTVEPHERTAVLRLRRSVLWRIAMGAGAVFVVGAVCLALYIYYTPTHGMVLQGVQGRYFLPVLPAVVLLFLGGRLVSTRGIRTFVFVGAAVASVAGLAVLDLHFYNSFLPYWG